MAAAGYALMRGVHIRADFIYRNWSPKTQATVDAVLYMMFYFPAMLFFFWSASEYAWKAWAIWETASDSTYGAPLAPARSAMPIGALLLFLQGFPELFRAFHQMGKERESIFVKILPFYLIGLALLFVGVFFDDILPIANWWDSAMSATGLFDFSKPAIGLFMLGAMLFSIYSYSKSPS